MHSRTPSPAEQVVHTHVLPVIVQESMSNVETHGLFGFSHALARIRDDDTDSDWDHDSSDI